MPLVVVPVAIAAGQSLSPAVDVGVGELVRLYMPAQWTPAHLSFQMSPDNTVYGDAFDLAGKEMLINVTPGAVIVTGLIWRALAWMKFRSGSRAQPVNQDAVRAFKLVVFR